jgi:hypothetical protein
VNELRWTAWPVVRSPWRAAMAIAIIGLLGWTIQSVARNWFFTAVGLLLVWGQVASFFVPTRYALSDEKVIVRGLLARKEKPWSDFRSYHLDREGVLLSPFVGPSRLERFRGLSLQFHGNKGDVMAFVERAMGGPGGRAGDVGAEGQGGEPCSKARAA